VNVEDAAPPGADAPLRPLGEQCDRLRAARAAADDAGVPLFLNARTDVCLLGVGAPGAERLALAVERVRAFAEAGADGVFVPGLIDPAEIAEVVAAVDLPLNLLASAALPPVDERARLGVARVSVGSGPMRAMLTLLRSIADELHERGTYELLTGGVLSYDDANRLFG
jgi:2-methylisocitrate lyase-like PEP mutase family enzyme